MLCSRSASFTSKHADVVAQREQEFAQVLGGAFVLRLSFDLAELGHAVDQARHVLAEQLLDLLRGGERILDRIVEDGGDDRLVVELQIGEDPGDFDRMAEIGVARRPHLRAVRLHREDVGAVDQPLVRVGIVGANLLDQFILSQHVPKMGRRNAFVQARKEEAGPRGGETRPRGGTYWAASAEVCGAFADALQRSSSAALSARPSTMKLSSRPARLASDWQSTSGRLSSVAPWQAAGPQFQTMSRVMNRPEAGTVEVGGIGRRRGRRGGQRKCTEG